MSYNENIPVSGLQLDAGEIQENFYQGPPNIRTDLTVHGNVTISGAQLYFKNSEHYIELDASNDFQFNAPVESTDYFKAPQIISEGDIFVNADYAGGLESCNVWFNATTESLSWYHSKNRFQFSENLKSMGTTISVGNGTENDLYYGFDLTEVGGPQLALRGFRYNNNLNTCQVSHDGVTWNTVGTAEFTGNISEVLSIGNKAYDKEIFVGTMYAQQAAGENYIKLDPHTSPTSTEMEFSVSGYDAKHLYCDTTYGPPPKFRFDAELWLSNQPGTVKYDFRCQDIYCGLRTASPHDGTIHFGAEVENVYIYGETVTGEDDTLKLHADLITLDGPAKTTGNLAVDGNLSLNDDYVSGDEDVTIGFNNSAETLKFDYGRTAFIASAPNFSIGAGVAEDITLNLWDDSATSMKIWGANATGKIMVQDAYGVGELNIQATISGVYQDLHNVTTVGSVTTNDIYTGNIYSDENLYVNASGLNANSYTYHYNDTPDGAYIGFIGTDDQFLMSNDLRIHGILKVDSNDIFLNYNGPEGNSTINFYDGGSPTGKKINWDRTNHRFNFNDHIYIAGDMTAASACITGIITATSVDIAGEVQCDSLRIDQAPVSEAITPTHSATISLNGVDCKVAVEVP